MAKTRLRKAIRFFIIGGLASTVLLAALAVAAVAFLKQAISRIDIDPKAFGQAIHQSMVATIRDGGTEEKLAIIDALNTASPADAAPYTPLLEEAVWDEDADVSVAASKALGRINGVGRKIVQ